MRRPLRSLISLIVWIGVATLHAQAATEPQTALINRDASVFNEATGKIYLVDYLRDSVIVLSLSKQASTIKVGEKPDAIAINPRTGVIYVVNSGSRSVSVIDSRTDQIVATIPTAARPYAIAVDEAANKVYVSNTFSNMLTVIDGAANTATNLRAGSADAILVVPELQRVLLLSYESDTLTELDPATGATTKLPAGAMHLWGIARAGKTLYISHVQDSNIAAIDLATHTVRSLATGAMPCAIEVSAKTGHIYVANFADGTVTVIDKEGESTTIPVAAHPQGLALDESAQLLYVASPQQSAVTVIDTKSLQVKRSYSDPHHPYAIAIHPATHAAYAVNLGDAAFTPLERP